jgi:hypothetical protein
LGSRVLAKKPRSLGLPVPVLFGGGRRLFDVLPSRVELEAFG